ncbi:hypothetical protein GCM10010371_46150 [Streptomyces subrutilus]|uniref:Uncharacterized protein n=1 Tax=Streptomyces subrutilus TaxID=36818 RepID=A0A918R395_9ACTN|nr:hypothetical protein GCM10010371_46150 [Streptomyces subrutilus]
MNGQERVDRQDRLDALDREMAARPLPGTALTALGHWWDERPRTPSDPNTRPHDRHAVGYTPNHWDGITPWPCHLAPPSEAGDAEVNRAQVTSAVADALRREAFTEALVATYVWGKGKSGTPGGSGPATLRKILTAEDIDASLSAAVTALADRGPKAAYAVLHRKIPGWGPSFSTKFLYFAGRAQPLAGGPDPQPRPQPLILDRVLSLRLRSFAVEAGRASGIDPDGSAAAWAWSGWGWSPHRYGVYLSFMQAASRQLAATDSWPSDAAPDLLEYALFRRA